jgi:thiosulfate dehydrogenase [quinone] large subunit
MGLQAPTLSRQQAVRQGAQTAGFTGLAVAGIVLTRVLLGLSFFFRDGVEKLHTWTTPKPLIRFVTPGIKNHNVPDFYRAFLRDVVVPNADLFRQIVMYSELLLGVCLVIGLGVRIGAALQSFALINYITVKTFPATSSNGDITMLILFLLLFAVGAGRYYGVDGLLRSRFRLLRWL